MWIHRLCAHIDIIIIIINTDLQHMHVYMLMSIGVCDIRCVMC